MQLDHVIPIVVWFVGSHSRAGVQTRAISFGKQQRFVRVQEICFSRAQFSTLEKQAVRLMALHSSRGGGREGAEQRTETVYNKVIPLMLLQ